MNGNPFFVDPTMGAEAIPGQLAGISSILNENRLRNQAEREKRAAEEKIAARQQDAIEAARGAFSSGDPDKIADVALNYPEISQQLKESVGIRSDAQAKEAAGFLREFALGDDSNRRQILERRIASVEARGGDASDSRQSLADYMENPESESRQLINFWAATGDEGYKAYSDEKKAEQLAAQQRRKEMREDQKMQMDYGFKSANLRLRQLESEAKRDEKALAAESNDLKRQQLQLSIDEKKQKMDMERAAVASSVSDASSTIDSAINTADQLLTHPGLSGAVGTSSVIPNIPGSDASDFEQTLASFNAKTFLSSVSQMKGLGALTEAEGAKLVSAAGALSPKMSETEFKKSLQTIRDGMEKAKGRLASKIPKGMQQPAAQAQPQSQGPQVGEVADGYTFMGGDPADPENWSQQ